MTRGCIMKIKKCSNRIQRVAQEIQRKISVILKNDINDPRIGVPTISGVCVSKDLKNAKIFVTFLDKDTSSEICTAIMILQRAARFIRFLLAKTMCLRVVPMLSFRYDASLTKGIKIYNLITKVKMTG